MGKLPFLLFLLLIVFTSGCIKQITKREYVCPDGSIVTDPNLCPTTTTTTSTTTSTTTIISDLNSFSYTEKWECGSVNFTFVSPKIADGGDEIQLKTDYSICNSPLRVYKIHYLKSSTASQTPIVHDFNLETLDQSGTLYYYMNLPSDIQGNYVVCFFLENEQKADILDTDLCNPINIR